MQLEHAWEHGAHREHRLDRLQEGGGGRSGTATVLHCPLVTGCLIRLFLTTPFQAVPNVAPIGFLDVQAGVTQPYGVTTWL